MKNKFSIFIILYLLASSYVSAQTCQIESAIPSTSPRSRFIDNGNGTITDKYTGLMWAKCAEGQSGSTCSGGTANYFNWKDALNRASASTLAGHNDWRLPNIKELVSIVEERCWNPAINIAIFPKTPSSIFWSSTPHGACGDAYSWYIDFNNGNTNSWYDRTYYFHVRLVRFSP